MTLEMARDAIAEAMRSEAVKRDARLLDALRMCDQALGRWEESQDMEFDYAELAKQHRKMILHFATSTHPERDGEAWACPECHTRVLPFFNYCRECGKKVCFDRRPKAAGGRKGRK